MSRPQPPPPPSRPQAPPPLRSSAAPPLPPSLRAQTPPPPPPRAPLGTLPMMEVSSQPQAPSRPLPAAGAAPTAAAPLVNANQEINPGTIICGRYKIERFLGRGGMGAVYAVQHINTGETLALKMLHPALASNAQAVDRFRKEARAPVKIGTDNVVRVVDADVSAELGNVPVLVMEMLQGRDLGTELKRRGALPAGEVVLYLRQIARALDKAHAMGIIHRDLKPANLYLTRRDDGTPLVKILDFGIAKLADGVSGELTQDGTIFGTPWYMSPEQARGNASKVGPSIDLWALGLIAFRLLTGRNYWTAEGMAALIGQIVYDEMRPPSQIAPHLGPRFDEWFARACNREVERRFTSATEQVTRLAEALGVSAGAPTQAPFEASHAQFPAAGMSASGMSISAVSLAGASMSGSMPAAMSMSSTPMSLPANPAGLSVSGAPLPLGTLPPGTLPPGSGNPQVLSAPPGFPAPIKQSNALSVAIGVLIAVLIAGGATAAWVLIGHKPPAPVAASPPPAPPPTAAPVETVTAAPTATAVAAEAATAAPTAPEAPVPSAEPSASAAASVARLAPSAASTFAPGAPTVASFLQPKSAGSFAVSAPKPKDSANDPTKPAPKVGKIQF